MRNSIITELEYKDGIYQGQTLQSRYKQGLGVYVWENGSAFYGEWKSDQIDGVGILFLPPRTTIQGHFTMGKLNGSCVIQTRIGRYYGKWLNGFPEGPMTSLLKDGEVTITFQDGKPCRGLSSREFSCEVPQLKSVQCHGSSAIQVLELPSGTFYGITGKDQGNKPNGLGVFVSIEGLFTCGQYKNGFLCGLGRTQQSGGEIYSGFFESGKFHGKGIYLFKEDELKWAKGLWRFGELIEIYESGFVRNCQSPKDLLFPYSDHKNPITIKQPINLNNIKELEDLFESQFQRQEPICNQIVTTPDRKSKQSTHKYFQNTLSTSYKRITEALMGKSQEVKSPRPQKLIQYYKKQLQDVDLNEQKESVPKNSGQKKSVQKSLSNSNFIKPRDTNKSSNKSISSSAYVEEIKKLQTQFTKPFDQNKSVQSHQSQLYQTILDQDEESQKSQRSDLFEKKHQESPIDQIIQRSQQYKDQQNKSSLNQSRQTQKHPSTKSRCKSTEGRKQSKNDQIKTKSEGNKIKYQEQTSQSQLPSSSARKSLNMDQSSQQQFREPSQPARESQQFRESQQIRESVKEQPQIRDSIPKDTKRSQGSSISQQVSQRISVKSNLVNQATPQKQEIDHEKKLSFCQQDFAQEMRGTAIFNQSDTQNKFHRHKRSQSQTELEKIADDDTQMQLVRQQQQYMQQLIEQQKRQLEELRFQQQQLEEEHASKNHKPGQVSVDSLDSYPQQSESFHQDFIRSVSEVLKSELRRKQEEDSMRDYQNHSPHFEQSKITNNQQSMFFNDQQSLDNVNAIEKQRGLSQQEDANRSRADSSMIKKQPISHSELDELQNEKNQDAQSRQSRYSRAQSQTSQRNTQSVKQQHSFHQSEQIQNKLPSEESIKKQEVKVQRSESVLSQQNSKRINDQSVRNQFDQQQEQEKSILKNQIVSRQSQQSIPQQNISHHSDQDDKKSKKHTDQKSVDLSQLSKMLEKQEIPQQSHSKQPSQQSLGFKQQEQQQQIQKVQQSTVKKNLNDSEQSIEQHFKSHKQSKQPSQTQLRYVPSPSQQLLPYQVFQSDKQMQIQPDQQSENIQVTISEDHLDTKQNIQDIKLQLAAQREILSQLYNSIQESRQLKVSQFESEKRGSELRTVKRCMIPSIDPCSSPIKKVIITKGAFPAFTIIKSLSPIRM